MKIIELLTLIVIVVSAVGKSPNNHASSPKNILDLVEKMKTVDKAAKKSAMPGKKVALSEGELNSYLRELAAEKGKGKVKSVKVELLGDKQINIAVTGSISWQEVFKAKDDSCATKILKRVGNLESSVSAKIQTASAKGKAYVKILSININGIKLPGTLVAHLLKYVGEKQRPPLDFSKLFPLPYGIQKAEITKGKVVISF